MRRTVLVAVVAAAALATWVAATFSVAVLASASMSPWAEPGDLLVHRGVAATELVEGDVVTVEAPGRGLVTHRVVAVSTDGDRRVVRLQGDRSRFPDPEPVELPDEVDRVVLVLPRLGSVLRVALPVLRFAVPLLLVGGLVLATARRPGHATAPDEAGTADTDDPRLVALLATCEQLAEDGVPAEVVADVVRVRTAALVGLPSAERSGAVLASGPGPRFYVLAVADVDVDALALVPVGSERQRAGTAALADWWAAVADDVPPDTAATIEPWLAD